jgi:lysozyme family protein
MRYSSKWGVYAKQWDRMVIQRRRGADFESCARFALLNKDRYVEIQDLTAHDELGREGEGIPWWMIAALHRRESDTDEEGNPRFDTYLGNGQPLNRKTTIVPIGRGPFKTFEDGALDAFKVDGLSSVLDWRLEKVLYQCEIFNGTGYNARGLPSPYIWAGTNIQKSGKYTGDGKWNGRAWDTQPGCAPIIATIARLDPSVTFVRET